MTVLQELEKEGITNIKALDRLNINSIAKSVSAKLHDSFPHQNLDEKELFMKLSRLDMYTAKMSGISSSAKYYYKNHSIYFNETADLSNIDIYAIHECIHALQECRDEKENLLRLGFCNFTSSKLPGMALNEASVQLMSSYAVGAYLDTVKYFDITLPTYSPSHYALETALLNQIIYITGTNELFNSTLYSNDMFMNKLIWLTSKSTFYNIEANFDKIMDLEDDLNYKTLLLSNLDGTPKKIAKLSDKISKQRMRIQKIFLDTQNLILSSYFDKKFDKISSFDEIEDYRKQLYDFKDFIGYTDTYSFYNDYYIKKMSDLETRRNEIENASYRIDPDSLLVPQKNGFIAIIFRKIKKLFFNSTDYENIKM